MFGFGMKKLACFVGGVVFGSAGVKLLSGKDAKKVYAHTAAAALRAKDCVMETVTAVKENADDILAEAKEINEKRAAEEEAAETVIEDESGDVEEAEEE